MIERKEWFTYRDSSHDNYFQVIPKDYEVFPMNTKAGGSYNVAPARLLGISYADYIRWLRTSYPDDILVEGKGHKYPVVLWKKGENLFKFIRLLNLKMSLALGHKEEESK